MLRSSDTFVVTTVCVLLLVSLSLFFSSAIASVAPPTGRPSHLWRTYYDALGVTTKNCSGLPLKKAYRERVKVYHPDKRGSDHEYLAVYDGIKKIGSFPRQRYDELLKVTGKHWNLNLQKWGKVESLISSYKVQNPTGWNQHTEVFQNHHRLYDDELIPAKKTPPSILYKVWKRVVAFCWPTVVGISSGVAITLILVTLYNIFKSCCCPAMPSTKKTQIHKAALKPKPTPPEVSAIRLPFNPSDPNPPSSRTRHGGGNIFEEAARSILTVNPVQVHSVQVHPTLPRLPIITMEMKTPTTWSAPKVVVPPVTAEDIVSDFKTSLVVPAQNKGCKNVDKCEKESKNSKSSQLSSRLNWRDLDSLSNSELKQLVEEYDINASTSRKYVLLGRFYSHLRLESWTPEELAYFNLNQLLMISEGMGLKISEAQDEIIEKTSLINSMIAFALGNEESQVSTENSREDTPKKRKRSESERKEDKESDIDERPAKKAKKE